MLVFREIDTIEAVYLGAARPLQKSVAHLACIDRLADCEHEQRTAWVILAAPRRVMLPRCGITNNPPLCGLRQSIFARARIEVAEKTDASESVLAEAVSSSSPRTLIEIYCANTARDVLTDEDLEYLIDLILHKLEPQAVELLLKSFPAFRAAADQGQIGTQIGLYIYYHFTVHFLNCMLDLEGQKGREFRPNSSILFDLDADFSLPLDPEKESTSDILQIIDSNEFVESNVSSSTVDIGAGKIAPNASVTDLAAASSSDLPMAAKVPAEDGAHTEPASDDGGVPAAEE